MEMQYSRTRYSGGVRVRDDTFFCDLRSLTIILPNCDLRSLTIIFWKSHDRRSRSWSAILFPITLNICNHLKWQFFPPKDFKINIILFSKKVGCVPLNLNFIFHLKKIFFPWSKKILGLIWIYFRIFSQNCN